LRIISAAIDGGSSTDQRVVADLGVADRLRGGQAYYRNVVFLVLDDRLLTFPGGLRIPGIIGFPVIEQMGEVQFQRDGFIVVPQTPSMSARRNLALDELTPITRVSWEGSSLVCRLDTGADRTQLYSPFYRRFQDQIVSRAPAATRRMGGAGGVRELPLRVLPAVALMLGGTIAKLDSVDVLTGSIVGDASPDFLDCNVGHDVFDAFSVYVFNFRDMSFTLR
jgi:hypothetical protein